LEPSEEEEQEQEHEKQPPFMSLALITQVISQDKTWLLRVK